MESKEKKLWTIIGSLIFVLIISVITYFLFFSNILKNENKAELYIDNDDNIDSVYCKMDSITEIYPFEGFKLLSKIFNYKEKIHTGHYEIEPGNNSLTVIRNLKNGHQTPINLVIPSVRTLEIFSKEVARKLMLDENELLSYLKDSTACDSFGYDTATIACMFIPNTYEIYWNVSLGKFMQRMKKEHDSYWNDQRKAKAEEAGLTPNEVSILASIIDEETANNAEKPNVAGMYINRLNQDMPLQADPTVKFALQQFQLRRIYLNMLQIDSPYNTYRNLGLPPGPIRIPTVSSIEAVLNYTHHNYLYMCAKEDFSGTHNFAATYSEHLQNARKYSQALNQRGIK